MEYKTLLDKNWKKYSQNIITEKSPYRDSEMKYLGRGFFDKSNPPFLASIIRISSNLWDGLQSIQADLEQVDDRQTYFHPYYFHITINEFGWMDQVNVEEIVEKLRQIIKHISPFTLRIFGINCFERIIFAQVFDEHNVLESIFNETLDLFPNLDRNFPDYIPHISLVKIDTTEAKAIIDRICEHYRDLNIGVNAVYEIELVEARPYLSVGRIKTLVKLPIK